VSRIQKIFLASALVVVGFGVARFLGQPVLPAQVPASHNTQVPVTPFSAPAAELTSGGSTTAVRARLLPDIPATPVRTAPMNAVATRPEPPALGSPVAMALTTNDTATISEMPRSVDCVPTISSPIGESGPPRAKLRNEAPRAIGVDPQSPVAIRRMPPVDGEVAEPYKFADVQASPMKWPAPPLLNPRHSDAAPSPATAIATSYNAPASPLAEGQVAPPLWPTAEENPEPRTHIVVDGDSLERLASRYLSDPNRSREIYELNRDVLTAPDLLPIGAELKIPDREASAPVAHQGFQPNSAEAPSNRTVVGDNWAPIRPASATQGVIPRAQLAPPVMVQ
jgi:nucleoid-associated protein YgaU